MMSFIAMPNQNFLQETNDMDHSVILDLKGGVEHMWFNIKRPVDIKEGSLLTITPIPSETKDIIINELSEKDLPVAGYGNQITYESFFEKASKNIGTFIYSIASILYFLLFIALSVFIIMLYRQKRAGRPYGKREKMGAFMSATLLFILTLFIIIKSIVGNTLGIGGTQSLSISALPGTMGLNLSRDDHVTVAYETTTSSGLTLQIVTAEDGKGLTQYLERNGLPKAPENEEKLTRYIKANMSFAITHIPLQNIPENGKKYVHISFPYDNIFFPLAVNFANSDEKHAVEALVLKPVTIQGFRTKLTEIEERRNSEHSIGTLNKTIAYFGLNNAPSSTRVYFFDKKSNYDHDITMKIGTSTTFMMTKIVLSTFTFSILLLAILLSFSFGFSLLIAKLPKPLKILYLAMPFVISLILFIFTIYVIIIFRNFSLSDF